MRLKAKCLDAMAHFAPALVAYADWLQPSNLAAWGGPLNGQAGRQQLVREIVTLAQVNTVVETGTHRGTTTEFLWALTGGPIYSAEASQRYYSYSRRRLANKAAIHLRRSDSRVFLRELAHSGISDETNVLFYLDAHWSDDAPLAEELEIILDTWNQPIILIDDFQVPDDPGYGFDDYGDVRLTLECFPLHANGTLSALVPSLPSQEETGARRGCLVLVDRRQEALISGAGLRSAAAALDRSA